MYLLASNLEAGSLGV